MQGEIQRGEARSVMGMEARSERQARMIVSQLVKEGLVQSKSQGTLARPLSYPCPPLLFSGSV